MGQFARSLACCRTTSSKTTGPGTFAHRADSGQRPLNAPRDVSSDLHAIPDARTWQLAPRPSVPRRSFTFRPRNTRDRPTPQPFPPPPRRGKVFGPGFFWADGETPLG
jgi:hypothetical protein